MEVAKYYQLDSTRSRQTGHDTSEGSVKQREWISISFREGVFTLGLAPPGFVDPGPGPAFLSHKMASSERHPLLSGACSQ